MIPEISASKVAGFIGLHRYQNASDVMYELLCKDKETRVLITEIEKTHNRRPFSQVVNEVLREHAIADCVSSGIRDCQRTTDVSSVLEEVEEQAKVILDLRCDRFSQDVRDQIATEVRGRVSKQRGLNNENHILNQYEEHRDVKVTERNTKTVRKDFGSFKLVGRTDGFVASENRIVDSKERTRMWPQVPLYDEIQLRCYMIMTGAAESELVERFPDGTTRHTKYMNDESKWNIIQTAIEKNTRKMNEILSDPAELRRVVFANTVSMDNASVPVVASAP